MDFLRFFLGLQAFVGKTLPDDFMVRCLEGDPFWVNFPSVPGLKQIKSVRDNEQFFCAADAVAIPEKGKGSAMPLFL